MRFVTQSLDCLNIHCASSTEDKDVTKERMDESDKRGGGRYKKTDTVCNDTQMEKWRRRRESAKKNISASPAEPEGRGGEEGDSEDGEGSRRSGCEEKMRAFLAQ